MGPYSGATIGTGRVDTTGMETVKEFTGLASDSREVRPGFLFAALPGTKTNGAKFVRDAVARGAIAVLGSHEVATTARALGVRFIEDENPRARLAKLSASFFGAQPRVVTAVTGTNGKTSVTVFLREIWTQLGKKAASMGTIGVVSPSGEIKLSHTTPDPIETHRILAGLKREGVDHLALEASSHGLDQYRLDGVEITAGAYTNITRDHLDYHETFESYLETKLRLFREVVRNAGAAVINMDAAHAALFRDVAAERGLKVLTVGDNGEYLKLVSASPLADGQMLKIACAGKIHVVRLPLVGRFQASNALVAAALAIALGDEISRVFDALADLHGAPGRLEKVAVAASGAPIFVDYAHTPDALATVLKALRPHATGRLHLIFGCGGDRDAGKRPLMGQAAARFADAVIVTDDNPRSEDPDEIRKQAMVGCPSARNIGDRAEAIREGIGALNAGDILVIAGKGHETGQIGKGVNRPFSDRDQAQQAAIALGGSATERRS
jgi:UDP-N-acetylmuramoyl-L-alanyl-D-glutamate--2,6-diaminopimelate ligase